VLLFRNFRLWLEAAFRLSQFNVRFTAESGLRRRHALWTLLTLFGQLRESCERLAQAHHGAARDKMRPAAASASPPQRLDFRLKHKITNETEILPHGNSSDT